MRYFIVLLLSISPFAYSFTPDEDGLFAVVDTTLGEFTIKLEYKTVPLTVGNFVGLAEGTIPRFDRFTGEVVSIDPFYDGLIFHWVKKWDTIRAGDPKPDDRRLFAEKVRGPGYTIPVEIDPELTHSTDYTVAMYNWGTQNRHYGWDLSVVNFDRGANTAGSQFYINLPPPPGSKPKGEALDGHYAIFGTVIDGTDVVDEIGAVPVGDFLRPNKSVRINTVTIIREGVEAEAFYITKLELPFHLEPRVRFVDGEENAGFEFTALPGAPYSIKSSSDLENWTEREEFTNDQDIPVLHSVLPAESGATFVKIDSYVAPISYKEKLLGTRLSFNLNGVTIGNEWTLDFNEEVPDFNEGGLGVITIKGYDFGEPVTIDAYEYHGLPNGARLKILTSNYHEIIFFLKFVDETTGSVFVKIDDYTALIPPWKTPNAPPPESYTSTGTFEMIRPSE